MNYAGYLGNFQPSVPCTIAAGETESSPIPAKGYALVGITLPSIFTGSSLTFLVGDSIDGYQANGEILFNTNPEDGDTLTLNDVELTFVDADPGDDEILIGATADDTMAALQAFLDASEDEALLALTYSSVDSLMTVTSVIYGEDGNAYTFDKSSTHIALTPSGGTLSGGGFRPLYNASGAVALTVAAGRSYAIDPANFQALQYFKVKSGSTEANGRTVLCSMKGF